jgi:hypothetical protein
MSYYSKIHQDSPDTVDNSLDLFRAPPTKTSILSSNEVSVGPTRSPEGSQIDFEYHTSDDTYIDPSKCYLSVACKVQTSAGEDIGHGGDLKVIPVCNFLHALFSIVQFSYGNHDITYEACYPFAAYLENLLSFSEGYKKTMGGCSLWFEDSIRGKDTADLGSAKVADIASRKALIANSKTVEMVGKINLGFNSQDRLLIPGSVLKLRLTRSDPSLCLLSTEADEGASYKIVIEKCELIFTQVKVHPSIVASHNSLHSVGHTVKYPLNKTRSQMFTIPQNMKSTRINLLINQQKPKRLFLAFINHNGKNGRYNLNPFKFQHFGIKSMCLEIDGQPFPSKPIQTDFATGQCTIPYFNLARATGKAFTDQNNGVSIEEYKNGSTIFGFDLTPDHCEGGGVHLIRNCSIVLDVTFAADNNRTISVFMYTESDDLIEIDQTRTVHRLSRM